jgi:hypothetical protein
MQASNILCGFIAGGDWLPGCGDWSGAASHVWIDLVLIWIDLVLIWIDLVLIWIDLVLIWL